MTSILFWALLCRTILLFYLTHKTPALDESNCLPFLNPLRVVEDCCQKSDGCANWHWNTNDSHNLKPFPVLFSISSFPSYSTVAISNIPTILEPPTPPHPISNWRVTLLHTSQRNSSHQLSASKLIKFSPSSALLFIFLFIKIDVPLPS